MHVAHSTALLHAALDAAEQEDSELLSALSDLADDLSLESEEGYGDGAALDEARSRVEGYLRDHLAGLHRLPDVIEEELSEACVPNRQGKGHHDDRTGHPCSVAKPGAQKELFGEPGEPAVQPTAGKGKARARRVEMHAARREGAGKEARVILASGEPAPRHITPAMVGADWQDVKVSLDPTADVLVTGRDKKGRAKTVYSAAFHMQQAAAKFARTQEGIRLFDEMYEENQRNRLDEALREQADCVWLMQEQATRPGSDADNKGTGQYFEHPVTKEDIVIEADEKKVSLRVKDQLLPIKDKKTKVEILRRLANGEPLLDSTYWLKSHGATTLEGRHVVEKEDGVYLEFVGKESVWHSHRIRNPELARMLLERKNRAGDRGKLFDTNYDRVTDYARTLDGGKFTPKDFRTQKATSLAIATIRSMEAPTDEKSYKVAVNHVGEIVSTLLGNNRAMALASYIDPTVFSAWRSV